MMNLKSLLLLSLLLVPALALAVPLQIPYSGPLSESGTLVNGTRAMTFVIYDAASGGSALYTQNEPSVTVTNGVYHVELNAPSTVWTGADRWLGVSVSGGTELTPRTKVGSVPYSFHAQGADSARIAQFRKIAWASGSGNDATCDVNSPCFAPLAARQLTFVKTQATTAVRVLYTDNMRVYSGDGTWRACNWYIRFNGNPCPSGDIFGSVYSEGPGQIFRPGAVASYCTGLPAGTYTVQVYVGNEPNSSQSRCYTGWNNQYWSLEAEEVY